MKLFDNLYVDEFHDTVAATLLTHWHGDHVKGLKLSFRGTVYCTATTATLLHAKYPAIKTYIVQANKFVSLGTHRLLILDANHLPGSIMFYYPEKHTFYTGDYRLSNRMLFDLQKHDIVKPIENLYVDGTFHSPELTFLDAIGSMRVLTTFLETVPRSTTIAFGIFHAGTCRLLVDLGIKFVIDDTICLSLHDMLRTMYPKHVIDTSVAARRKQPRFRVVQPNKFIKSDDVLVIIPCALWFCCVSNRKQRNYRTMIQDNNQNWRLNFSCHSDYKDNLVLARELQAKRIVTIGEPNINLLC